ncbi:MAG TPA: ATP-binding protein [Anaerolineales bacterium]|nr:ATP-binding protein [Anaerolineales bacterium]
MVQEKMSRITDPDIERLTTEMELLTQVARLLASPVDLSQWLEAVLGKIHCAFEPVEKGAILLWDEPAGVFRPAAACGVDFQVFRTIALHPDEGITGKTFREGNACLLTTPEENVREMDTWRPANRAVFRRAVGSDALPQATMVVPITHHEQKFGVLVLQTYANAQGFREMDLPFIQTLAGLVALGIDRARLETQTGVIHAARQAEQMHLEVMAALSHQLRMPLSAIKGYSSALLLDEVAWSEEKRAEFLHIIEEECDSMEAMIGKLLDSSLIDLNQLTLERQPLRLQHMAHEVVTEMLPRMEIHRPVIDFPADFPIIEADPRWIRQVFRNILDNAIKYSPEGGLVVIRGEVRVRDVLISIADQGLGISPEDLVPLFEKFYRVKASNGYHIPGTGLGLPIARSIVQAHGGRIWAESQRGEGTTLYFSLPLAQRDGNE